MKKETALKILRERLDKALFSERTALVTLIPELAENEDERIRKALFEIVHDTTGDKLLVGYNVHKEDALAWLEGICVAKREFEKQGKKGGEE